MARLAIKGHATRGREVIELLEMLGGKNIHNYNGTFNECYVIDNGKICSIYTRVAQIDGFVIITLEEFLEKFPHKVGDKVCFSDDPNHYLTIKKIWWNEDCNDLECTFHEDAIDVPVKDLQPYNKKETMEDIKIHIPEGYEFAGVDDDKQQVVFTKIKPKYPKTYEECCSILGCKANDFFTNFSYNRLYVEISDYEEEIDDLLQIFRKLIYCRDAYWKIAGEEMGLGKAWRPDWNDGSKIKYGIEVCRNSIHDYDSTTWGVTFAFPTEEMRDAFHENFKELIEQCKELL